MKTFDNRDSIYESKTLPTSGGDSNSTSTKGAGRFRFPFRQKPLMMMSSSSAGSGSGGGGREGGREGGGGGSGGGGSSPYSLFNFRKLGNSKNTGGMTGTSAQPRKSVSFSGMDWKKKISADHTDVAYREAVSRLRSILSPRPHSLLDSSPLKGSLGDVSGVGLGKSFDLSSTSPPTSRRDRFNFRSIFSTKDAQSAQSPTHNMSKPLNNMSSVGSGGLGGGYQSPNQLYSYLHRAVAATSNNCEDDLFEFINKQGEYIAQLEKETKYCRDDLTSMLDKVRDVITENEALHERQKRDLLNNMIDQLDEKTDGYESHGGGGGGGGSRGSDKFGKNSTKSIMKSSSGGGKHSPGGGGGPSGNVILESKIAEMDAQLSQAKRNLHLAQEEILELRKNRSQSVGLSSAMEQNIHNLIPANVNPYAHCDLHRAEIENLNREKQDLLETLSKFKLLMSELRDRESDAAKKVKNSLDIVETMQNEKTQSDLETRRLKDELERHQQRLRDFMTENSKKIQEEKLQIELKYRQEIDMLNSNINVEMDSLTRARVELERARRIEVELKRDIQVKSQTLEDLRQENLIRMGHMQSELSQALLMKSQAEQDLINSRLLIEKVERDGRQEAAKLQAEITGLRQRMEASDMDLINAQEIIVKLNENIGHLQRENSVLKGRDGGDESEMSKIIRSMEDKHSRDMTDLEQLIQAQNGLLDKLRGECKMLTDKLDDTSKQYRQDFMVELQSCVSTLRLDNEKSKGKENDPNHPPNGPAPEKVTALLKELEGVVSEMSKWLSTHSSAAADDDESEEEDDEEEESEEEDDDEEEAEAEDVAETKEGDEKATKEAEGEADKEEDAVEDADAAAAAAAAAAADKEAKEAPEPKSENAEGGEGEEKETEKEESKEKADEDEKEKEKGESEEGAESESEAPPPTEGATGAGAGAGAAEEAGGKPEVPTASDDEAARDKTSKSPTEDVDVDKKKEKDKKDHAESAEADKKADKSKAHAPSKGKESAGAEAAVVAAAAASTLSEMNERLEVWIQKIQSVIQRFSSYFPNKVGC